MTRRFRVVSAGAGLPHHDREAEALADIADIVFLGAPPRDELYAAVANADIMLTELTPVDDDLLDHALEPAGRGGLRRGH